MDIRKMARAAAQRIITELEEVGLNVSDPGEIRTSRDKLDCNGLYMDNGASRLVIWDNYFDFVIKIALSEDFECYNEHEVEVYANAYEEELEDGFAWCECYRRSKYEKDSYVPSINVMEFLDGNEDDISDDVWEYGYKQYCKDTGREDNEDARSSYRDAYYDEEYDVILELVVEGWSTEKANRWYDFLRYNNVNDIHIGNVLYRNDKLVICDYAGW